MSKLGGEWLVEQVKQSGGSGKGLNVLTVCNTGSLATSVRIGLVLYFYLLNDPCALGIRDRAGPDHLPV